MRTYPIEAVLYLHGDKESVYQVGKELRLGEKQLEKFIFAGYEHKMKYLVYEDGTVELIAVDDRPLLDLV